MPTQREFPIVCLKTCISLFEIHIDSLFSAKNMAENSVGLQPNVACEFKRAGFLEWRNDWNIAADWAATKPVTEKYARSVSRVLFTRSCGLAVMGQITRLWLNQHSSGSINTAVAQSTRQWLSQLGSGFACSALQENRPV
jgi:hypothetical protein